MGKRIGESKGATIETWHDFFVAEVGASAGLAGLLFVAISINIEQILAYAQLPIRAAHTLLVLTGAFLVASVSLCPGEPARIAAVLVVVTVATWAGSLTFAIKYLQTMGTVVEGGRSQGKSLGYLISFALTTQFATVPSLVGALLGVAEVPGAVYWIGGGVLAAFTVAIFNTWVLLVEIRR